MWCHQCNITSLRWHPPRYILSASASRHERIRKKWHILTEGENLPPPIKTFKVNKSHDHHVIYYCNGIALNFFIGNEVSSSNLDSSQEERYL